MNSTLKSLLFWVVLVAIALLIWEFSSTFQRGGELIGNRRKHPRLLIGESPPADQAQGAARTFAEVQWYKQGRRVPPGP